jgi:hypothetical protein
MVQATGTQPVRGPPGKESVVDVLLATGVGPCGCVEDKAPIMSTRLGRGVPPLDWIIQEPPDTIDVGHTLDCVPRLDCAQVAPWVRGKDGNASSSASVPPAR